jgi:hypothetical protein
MRIEKWYPRFGFIVTTGAAGKLYLGVTLFQSHFGIHFAVSKKYRFWGRSYEYYDGPIYMFGGGPFFMAIYDP